MPRSVCIIQARLGSKRFPNKILADIAGHPMIWHVVERARQIRGIDEVIIATVPADWLAIRDVVDAPIFKGGGIDEEDVLRRYAWCAKNRQADIVVRVTADCPLLDPERSSKVLAALGKMDYVTNRWSGADGWDTEAMTYEAIERAEKAATGHYDREHVTPYIYQHPHSYRVVKLAQGAIGAKWSVDTVADLERVRGVMRGN